MHERDENQRLNWEIKISQKALFLENTMSLFFPHTLILFFFLEFSWTHYRRGFVYRNLFRAKWDENSIQESTRNQSCSCWEMNPYYAYILNTSNYPYSMCNPRYCPFSPEDVYDFAAHNQSHSVFFIDHLMSELKKCKNWSSSYLFSFT